MDVHRIAVDRRYATWWREGDELVIKPRHGLRKYRRFTVMIAYSGVPETITDPQLGGLSGFVHTDDGTLVAGQPDSAATWYPVNDHPLDKASYTFHIRVPAGLEAVANGVLTDKRTRRGQTTWSWKAREPMASYLTTATIGEFDLDAYREDGIKYWDAIDPDLYATAPPPRSGSRYAISQAANTTYKRLTRTISVPADGGQASFWVFRDTEPNWDYLFVEARTPGSDDWTTLPDLNGHTSQETGNVCPYWLDLHPFLEHYQTPTEEGCDPVGTTGEWHAASGMSEGYEQWAVDLGPYAGGEVELSISYASDDLWNFGGVFVDDVVVSTGEGSTSFEDGLDGWTVPGAPAGTPPNENDWVVGGADAAPPSVGDLAKGALDRQPEIIAFLEDVFGPYPFRAAGGIVDDVEGLGFALENQTRPVYSKDFFSDRTGPVDSVVVHELAHQWVGDHLALARWQDIWLNEGFATYSEWLWSEDQDRATAQEWFDFTVSRPADDPWWQVVIGDPGPDLLFDGAVYDRGAATLHALRLEIGDADFFRLLRRWTALHGGGNVVIPQFTSLAERISGEDLDAFFDAWLFTPAKPAGLEAAQRRTSAAETSQSSRRAAGSYATLSARASRKPSK